MKKTFKISLGFVVALVVLSMPVQAKTDILSNTEWSVVDDESLAMTRFAGNPFAGEEGAVLSSGCVKKESGKVYRIMSLTIGDNGTVPERVQNALDTVMGSSEEVVDNERYGLSFQFDDGSNSTFQFKKLDKRVKGDVVISTMTAPVSPDVIEKVKMRKWVDIEMLVDGELVSMLKPFSLSGSKAAVEKISTCYGDF